MDINSIVLNIPNIVASLYEDMYCFSKKANRCYKIQYTGEKLTLSVPKSYDEIKKYISNFKENFIDDLEEYSSFKKVLMTKDKKEKLVSLVSVDDYKLLMVVDITNKREIDKNKKILIIADDSPIITKFFSKTFINDYEVLVAKNGREAIELANEYMDKQLVGLFLDLQMPEVDGFAVLDYFKENNLFSKIPVSVISGEDSEDGIQRAMSYGIVDMINKPFSAEAARRIVEKTISFSPKK